MLYTKTIDIGIIGNALLGEICAQISTVGSDGKGKLLQGEVMLKIELCVFAAFLKQYTDVR